MTLPLEGIKVLDFTQILAGPTATQLLGDMGADVIKVEPLGQGDRTRGIGPKYMPGDESPYFHSVNRNKRSIAINLKRPEGREIVLKLAKTADVVVQNFRLGVMERLGIDYKTLSQINPRIIFCSISGWGPKGPDRDKPGSDMLAQAMSGLISINGGPEEPCPVGTAPCDVMGGILAAFGVMNALFARERTGMGQEVHASLLAAGMFLQPYEFAQYLNTGDMPGKSRIGNYFISPPFGAFRAKDGQDLAITARWSEFCEAIGREDLVSDPRFDTYIKRIDNRDQAIAVVQDIISKKTRDEWLLFFAEKGIRSAPVYTYDQVCSYPQVRANDLIITMKHSVAGEVKTVGIPVHLSQTPGAVRLPAPTLGQHTGEILSSLGYSDDEIAQLVIQEVVA